MRRALLVVLVVWAWVRLAAAHVSPSVDDNNRFLKLTPLGDRVRLAYTVMFGDNPGRAMRPGLDTNADGIIDDSEAQAFGAKLARDVGDALDLDVDGKPQKLAWAEVAVGMGAPQTKGGTFSIDLVGYLCLPTERGAHQIALRDHFKLNRPGETEVQVEDAPGVKITRARIGPADDPSFDYKFVGPGGPLAEDGLDLRFDAGPRAVVAADGACRAAEAPGGHALLIGLAVGGACGIAIAALFVLRRRAQRA